jgi:hypothetical protein
LLAFGLGCQGKAGPTEPVSPGEALTDASPPLLSRTRPLMSTVFRIQVDSPPGNAENVIRQAFEEIERLETVLSEWRDDSDISKVNKLAGKKSVKVGDDTLRVVDAGVDVSMWSRGAFDLSWAALWGLYDFRPDSIKIPTPEEIKPRLGLIDYKNIRVSKKYKTVFLKKRGMVIGTGGIAKGYALDHAGAILRGGGVESYMIFGGGQVQVHGERDGRPWRVGIQHPRDPSSYFAALEWPPRRQIALGDDYDVRGHLRRCVEHGRVRAGAGEGPQNAEANRVPGRSGDRGFRLQGLYDAESQAADSVECRARRRTAAELQAVGRTRDALCALFDRHERAVRFAHPNLARAEDTIAFELFEQVCQPSGDA